MKAATNRFAGRVVDLLRRVALLQAPGAHHRHAVAHRHRLDLVVGDVERGDAEAALDPRDLGAHVDAQLRVEVRERLVHQERGGRAHDRAAHRDALALAAGELGGLAVEVLGQAEDPRRLLDLRRALLLGHLAQLSEKPMFSATVMCG